MSDFSIDCGVKTRCLQDNKQRLTGALKASSSPKGDFGDLDITHKWRLGCFVYYL